MTVSGMKNDVYTVRQVARMAGVGIKTLHHYDAIGLLRPLELSAARYRLYGRTQLERLQQILFCRELGFPLKDIETLLNGAGDRLSGLRDQRERLMLRQKDVSRLIATIDRTIAAAEGESEMNDQNLFEGFHSEAEWNAALAEHNKHLKSQYGAEVPPVTDAGVMNDAATQAKKFTAEMIAALRDKADVKSERVQQVVKSHLAWLMAHGHATGAESFVTHTQYFIDDDFHRNMLESQQVGLSYYLNSAARALAAA